MEKRDFPTRDTIDKLFAEAEFCSELVKSEAWKAVIKPDILRHIAKLQEDFLRAVEHLDMIGIQQRILALKEILTIVEGRLLIAENAKLDTRKDPERK